MKITRIRLDRQFQPFHGGLYTCSGNRSALGFDSAIVAIGHGDGIPAAWDGLLFPPHGAGLGIAIRDDDLGDPIFETTKPAA